MLGATGGLRPEPEPRGLPASARYTVSLFPFLAPDTGLGEPVAACSMNSGPSCLSDRHLPVSTFKADLRNSVSGREILRCM